MGKDDPTRAPEPQESSADLLGGPAGEVSPNDADEESKWWIDRGPKKREANAAEGEQTGIIERWAFELLKDYHQERALKNIVNINQRAIAEFDAGGKRWGYMSLGVGRFPQKRLNHIREGLRIPRYAKALILDAGYSVRFLITGDPAGEKVVDINFTETPSMDYWVNNELVEERLFSSIEEALRKLRQALHRYLRRSRFSLTL